MQQTIAHRMIALLAMAVFPFALAAQDSVKPKKAAEKPAAKKEETPPAKEGEKSGAREVTYLDLVHARDKALKLKEDNMRDIQLLNALGAAMPEAVDKGASDQIAT
ncbi:MAG TPA: hypothetical protein PKM44_15710, partial [Turneriella sp.]|nr:hypothetical protein [Turneriella sp.]